VARVLIADDQPDILTALRLLLKAEKHQSVVARSPREVLERIPTDPIDALLLDLNYARGTTSGQEGLDLLTKIKEQRPDLPVIVMTAWASIDLAVEAVRRGARDFVQKPWDNERLLATLRTQLELTRALRSERHLKAEHRLLLADRRVALVAQSAAMQPVLELIERVGPAVATVLITGEHGTGKGIIARAIHAHSLRSSRPLLTVNMGALGEHLFESELFGHVAGAFTDARFPREGRFELADEGTLFLDEIGNLPRGLQAKLLRVIETGEFERVGSSQTERVDVRLIAATNADLVSQVREGVFREDLYYRLNTIEIRLPPLRERREDIVPLAEYFLATHAQRYESSHLFFSAEAVDALCRYNWPGNVRQLEHSVERSALVARGDAITAGDLGLGVSYAGESCLEEMTLEEVEQVLIRKALARAEGNVTGAALALGLSRSALYRRLSKYGFFGEVRGICQ
jgi:DNA-binding NtrC family response regulator